MSETLPFGQIAGFTANSQKGKDDNHQAIECRGGEEGVWCLPECQDPTIRGPANRAACALIDIKVTAFANCGFQTRVAVSDMRTGC